jgi:hypothetical protein
MTLWVKYTPNDAPNKIDDVKSVTYDTHWLHVEYADGRDYHLNLSEVFAFWTDR